MSTSNGLSLRSKALTISFVAYAIFNLISMATMSIGAAVLMGTICLTSLSFELLKKELQELWKNLLFKRYLQVSVMLALCCALSLICALIFPLSFSHQTSEIHFFKDLAKTWYLFWPCLLVLGLRRIPSSQRASIFWAWLITFALLSLLGIYQHFTGWPRPQIIPGENHFHATLFLGHHLSVASVFIFPFFVCLEGCVMLSGRQRMFCGVATVLGGLTLFLTYSRTLWVALPIGLALWCLLKLKSRLKWAGLVLILGAALAAVQVPVIHQRLFNGMGISTRQDLWLANFEFFKERPLFGVGLRHNQELSGYYLMEKLHSSDVFSGHAHNNLLDMLSGIGGLGTLAWITWCFTIFAILLNKKTRTLLDDPLPFDFRTALICAWVVFQINGLTQLNFWEGKVQHQMAWVIAWSLL